MNQAYATPPPNAIETSAFLHSAGRVPRLSLVLPKADRPALRAAHILSTFTDWLSLTEADARQLQRHFGLSPDVAQRLGIKSVPSCVVGLVLCGELKQLVGDGEWPAGFYVEGESLRFDCETRYGLILQVWRRWPVGLQFYRHVRDERPRWISSADHPTGTSAVASIHCQAMKREPAGVERAFLVDHTMRALAVAVRHGVSTVGLNGAAASSVPAQLFESFPGLRGVVAALSEPHPRLERELTDAGLSVCRWEGGELL